MNSGTVIYFDPAGGYGFIHPADGGRNVCVLKSAVEPGHLAMLRPGRAVDYDATWNLAGTLLAINLKLRTAERR